MTTWYSTFTPAYEEKMDVSFYYRTRDKKLHQLAVTNADNYNEARQSVMEHLCEEREVFLLPILGVIKGGKA